MATMTHVVSAEIVGSVLSVETEVGAGVEGSDTLVVLESTTMEIPVLAEVSGTVSEVLVKVGDVVCDGDPLVVIE